MNNIWYCIAVGIYLFQQIFLLTEQDESMLSTIVIVKGINPNKQLGIINIEKSSVILVVISVSVEVMV